MKCTLVCGSFDYEAGGGNLKSSEAISRDNQPYWIDEIRVHCASCDGHGRRKLTEIERNTLASLDDDWQTTRVVHFNLGSRIEMTAVVNRLNDLVKLGLVRRRRLSKMIEWRLA